MVDDRIAVSSRAAMTFGLKNHSRGAGFAVSARKSDFPAGVVLEDVGLGISSTIPVPRNFV
jgi:hypothetical protein